MLLGTTFFAVAAGAGAVGCGALLLLAFVLDGACCGFASEASDLESVAGAGLLLFVDIVESGWFVFFPSTSRRDVSFGGICKE
jgi:hypothetical protein